MEKPGKMKKVSFKSVIQKEGINPYVDPPLGAGEKLGKKGVVPVKVWLDGKAFRANLMPLGSKRTQAKPGQHHRLYLHGIMRKAIGKDVGDEAQVELMLDVQPRIEPMNPALAQRFKKNRNAKAAFGKLSSSRQKELNRYLNHLKGTEALQRNVQKVMKFLCQPGTTWFGKKNRQIAQIGRSK